MDIAYGKAREIKGDLYIIVYQYEYDRVGVESARLAVDIINALIKNNNIILSTMYSLSSKLCNKY